MGKKTIKKCVSVIDERLPLDKFIAVAREHVNAMPLEIVENGIRYQANDIKTEIIGYLNFTIAIYTEV